MTDEQLKTLQIVVDTLSEEGGAMLRGKDFKALLRRLKAAEEICKHIVESTDDDGKVDVYDMNLEKHLWNWDKSKE